MVRKVLVISMLFVVLIILSWCVGVLWSSQRSAPSGSCQEALARRQDAEVHLTSAISESDRQDARDQLASVDEDIRRTC